MREIEFRAYLKKEHKIVEVKSLHIGTRKIMYGYSETREIYGNTTRSLDECELMQYTGLKDKNGKKIFEGDFVKARHNDELYKVHWESFRFIIEDNYGNVILPVQGAIDHFECEVVGNIYDNPELLKGE